VGGLGRMGEYVGVAILQKRSCSNTLSLYKYVCVCVCVFVYVMRAI